MTRYSKEYRLQPVMIKDCCPGFSGVDCDKGRHDYERSILAFSFVRNLLYISVRVYHVVCTFVFTLVYKPKLYMRTEQLKLMECFLNITLRLVLRMSKVRY